MPSRAPAASHPDQTRSSISPSLGLEARAPVRRNLFSAHLSRRSVSSTQTPPVDVSTSHSASNVSKQAQHSSLFSSPQPSITPASPFASRPPQLHPSFSAAIDPKPSPNGRLSPRISGAHFPHPTSIIARDPTTGKPLLPQLPTLPRRLKLDEDDEEDEDEDDDEDDEDDDNEDDDEDEDADEEEDREIESLNQLNSRDRHSGQGRAKSGPVQIQANATSSSHDPFAAAPTATHPTGAGAEPGSSSSPGTLAYPTTAMPTDRDEEALEAQRHDAHINALMTRYRSHRYAKRAAHPHTARARRPQRATGGQTVDEEVEEEELMNHLRSALRKEVCRAEEEAWMFGEVERSWMRGRRFDQEVGGMVMGGSAGVGIGYE